MLATQAEERKRAKYHQLASNHIFMPVAIETSGVFGSAARDFMSDLSGRMKRVTGEVSSQAYLLQQLSVGI